MGENRTGFILKIAEKRTTFNWIFYLLVLILGKGNYCQILAGLPLIIAGAAIRITSSGTIKKNEVLTSTGPYGMCRNPLYLGSLMISLGFVIASWSAYVFVYFIVFFPLTYVPTILMEEKFLTKKFGDAYILYMKQTPAFFPDIRKASLQNFSWEQVGRNKEYVNWTVILVLFSAALIKSHLILQK